VKMFIIGRFINTAQTLNLQGDLGLLDSLG